MRGKASRCGHRYRCRRDHPRVCGEKLAWRPHFLAVYGSPPRMRGKGADQPIAGQVGGITPAYAGKSPETLPVLPAFWDHPRVCGEKRCRFLILVPVFGSPPRMRGKDRQKSRKFSGVVDHPRVCGEKPLLTSRSKTHPGSPPRMRGKDHLGAKWGLIFGITPAYAGKSFPIFYNRVMDWDHPRVCGEKSDFPTL